MTARKRYAFKDLVKQCDPSAPTPDDVKAWEQMPNVGLEQTVMEDQVDIRDAVLRFRERLTDGFGLTRLILFGSRARGDYHAESDADVAVILSGKPGDFVETKLAMADHAFDVLLETGVRIQAFPIWESQWQHPEQYSHPAILGEIARDGLVIWSASP